MSNKSIGSKIQSLEEKLKAENESRGRDDSLSNNIGRNASPRPATSGPPRPMAMPNKPRLRHQLDLHVPAYQSRSKDSIDTENQLRDIKKSGILTTDSKQYQIHIKDLEQLGELGNGTCGHVVKMLHKPSGSVIAVKQMRRSGNSDENKRILMDLDVVLRSDGCPYIVRCLGCFITEADVWICMELMASCFDKILKKLRGPVPEDILGKVTVATVKALSYLKEEHGVIHRDVKPSNILVDERGHIKLCDFGISGRLVDSKAKTRSAGCAAYMAPERIDPPDPQKPDYDIRADVWSLGISLVELATGIFPYRNCQNEFDILTKVIAEEPPMLPESQTFSPDFKSFVHSCLIKNYRHRPKYAALLEHPFVQRASNTSVRVDKWLASLNDAASPASPPAHQRSATSPVARCRRVPAPNDSVDPPPLSFNHQPLSPSSPPLLNGSVKQLDSPSPPVRDREKPPPAFETRLKKSPETVLLETLADSPVKTPEGLDRSFTLSVDDSPKFTSAQISDKNNKLIIEDQQDDPVKIENPFEDCDSGSFGSMNIEDVNMVSSENLADVKRIEETTERNNRFRPIEKPQRRDIHRRYVFAGGNASDRSGLVPLAAESPSDRFRGRSFSNASAEADADALHRPHRMDRFAAGSPKNHFANMELRNQPFSGGGHESRNHSSRGPDSGEFSSGGFHPYGSPEVNRRQFFPSCRPRECESEVHPRRPTASPFQSGTESYENVPDSRFSPPRFRTDAPTSYFTSTAVCSVSRYFPPSVPGQLVGPGYHHNPGGSCSQPASLEAYGDGRHYPPYSHSRGPDKIHSPALWSPQPAARRAFHTTASREREERDRDRWRNTESTHQHHQVQGNTSPIVLQRFYHQQSQRRSRRDLRDGSPHHSSISREASVGRSPEPPRRLNRDRDASLGRVDLPPCPVDHPLSREKRERDRIPPETEGSPASLYLSSDRDVRPDLIKPHRRHDRHSHDSRENDCSMPSLDSDMESLPPTSRERFPGHSHHRRERERKGERNGDIYRNDRDIDTSEAEQVGLRERFELRSQKESSQLRRERERKAETNGDSQRSDREDNCDKESLSTAKERFELRMQEKKNHKGAYSHHPKEKDRTEVADGEPFDREENGRVHHPPHRHGKSHGKDKDEQGWLNSIAGIVKRRFTSYVKLHLGANNSGAHRSASPNRVSGPTGSQHGGSVSSTSSRSCRFPRRIAHSDCDSLTGDSGKRLQDCSHNFVPGFRYGSTAPMPPPRRGTESWSLPASPLPARPT